MYGIIKFAGDRLFYTMIRDNMEVTFWLPACHYLFCVPSVLLSFLMDCLRHKVFRELFYTRQLFFVYMTVFEKHYLSYCLSSQLCILFYVYIHCPNRM